MRQIKIICTLGPSSFNKSVLKNLRVQKVDIFRINLSHTNINEIKNKINYLKKNKVKNICIDTEGAQIRTTHTIKKYFINKKSIVEISNENLLSNKKKIFLYPPINFNFLKIGTRIDIGFNNLSIQVAKKNTITGRIFCKVIKSGFLESKKGVHIHSELKLPCLTKKDQYAIKIARKLGIRHYAISFVNSHKDLEEIKKITGKNVFIISKIETNNAIMNLNKITKLSDALLIDRGDLSRYVPIEKIPLAQENIIKCSKKLNTPTYVATNLLENMIKETQPTRAESHDVYSTLKEGAQGLVLAAETAIGVDPVGCVKFLKRCVDVFEKRKKKFMLNTNKKGNYLFKFK
tara:strand:- start:2386 stop:3426 length:1041 start_codon:yes stop_codon:yes gene_type:complete